MKRITVFVLAAVMLIFCCGCSKNSGVKPVLKEITFVADIDYKDDFYSCDVKISSDNSLLITVLSPKTLKDMIIEVEKEKTTIEYLGLTYSPNTGNFPMNSAIKVLYNTIADANKKTLETEDGKNPYIEGKYGDYEYIFYFSPTGIPLELKVDSLNLKVRFNNVTVKKEG